MISRGITVSRVCMQASFSLGQSHTLIRSTRPRRGDPLLSTTLCSDSAVKQILLAMNEKESFIIEDLDDFHVVIKADEEYRVRRELEAEVSRPTSSASEA